MKTNILVVTTFNNHFRFFQRLARPLSQFDCSVHFITNKLSILKEAKKLSTKISPLKKESQNIPGIDIGNSFEIAAGQISRKKGEEISASVFSLLEKINSAKKIDIIFLWGGVRIIEYSAAEFARRNNIKTLFFELGNFPDKLFVDPLGTNAKSLLAKEPDVLKQFYPDISLFEKWVNDYIESGLKQHQVPQSKGVGDIDIKKNLLDEIGFHFNGLVQNEPLLTKEKLTGKLFRRISSLEYDRVDPPNDKYLFYPMQVNKDAQLILNSNIGNLRALEIASEQAGRMNAELFVKPHPAEVEYNFIREINFLKQKLGYKFVSGNTLYLIKNAEKVITINSTVGLQAELMGKNVECLGKAFYSGFDRNSLAAYILEYLIDADFWGDSEISREAAREILNRVNLAHRK